MKVLFDTDIGSDIDDALALLLLLRIPEVELLGVTTVYGRVDTRAKIARKILDAAGRSIPVHVGLSEPFASPMKVWHAGTEGHGVLTEEEYSAPIDSSVIGQDAPGLIVELVEGNPHEVVIVCVGALTNLAAALRQQPELASIVKAVCFMGGGVVYPGTVFLPLGDSCQARSSHNVKCDVKAAQEVFGSGLPMTVVTNDVTTRLWWDGKPVEDLVNASEPADSVIVGTMLGVWLEYRSRVFEKTVTGTCPHDPLTVAEAVGEQFVTYAPGRMVIHDDASSTFAPGEEGPHRAGIGIARDRFIEWFSARLTGDLP